MADKRDGDELFEDLDKFFAPIQDVDWDEPTTSRRPPEPRRSTSRCARRAGGRRGRARRPSPAERPAAPETRRTRTWYDTR